LKILLKKIICRKKREDVKIVQEIIYSTKLSNVNFIYCLEMVSLLRCFSVRAQNKRKQRERERKREKRSLGKKGEKERCKVRHHRQNKSPSTKAVTKPYDLLFSNLYWGDFLNINWELLIEKTVFEQYFMESNSFWLKIVLHPFSETKHLVIIKNSFETCRKKAISFQMTQTE